MGALDDDFEPGLAGIAEAADRAGNAGEIGAGETEIFERDDRTDIPKPAQCFEGPGPLHREGAGVVCVLTFQAKASGPTNLSITRGGAMNSAGKPLQAQTSQATLDVH